jgi:GntR family transcriptional regulator / MocR family aminotransferase
MRIRVVEDWYEKKHQFDAILKYHLIMPRIAKNVSALESSLPGLKFSDTEDVPLYRQVYQKLRTAITSGKILAGTKLPATRALAQTHGISRNTVLIAFEQLIGEGFLEARTGDGTYVAQGFSSNPSDKISSTKSFRQLSRRGALLAKTPATVNGFRNLGQPKAFRHGIGDLEMFPWNEWARLSACAARQPINTILDYSDPAGYLPLREAIAAHLRATRAVNCSAQQVIVVTGSQQALQLCAQLLLDPNEAAWFEQPGYMGARGALIAAGIRVVGVPVDDAGLNVAAGMRIEPNARLAYVTPSHQFPTGVTMSLERRQTLLAWAKRTDAWIIEDDYDSEYRYDNRPLESLQSLDCDGRVIYCGTFSKTLFPGLRLGYMVVPEHLIEAFSNARALLDRSPPGLTQVVLHAFMQEGHFARHVRRTKKAYLERQYALRESLERHLGDRLELRGFDAGMHLCARLNSDVQDTEVSRLAAEGSLEVLPVSALSNLSLERGALMLGYAAISVPALRLGAKQLANIISRLE